MKEEKGKIVSEEMQERAESDFVVGMLTSDIFYQLIIRALQAIYLGWLNSKSTEKREEMYYQQYALRVFVNNLITAVEKSKTVELTIKSQINKRWSNLT